MDQRETCLYIKYTKKSLEESKVVIVIPSRIIKKAVLRNKLRRRTREILRKNSDKIKKGRDLAIVFKKGSENLDFKSLENEILRALGN